MILVCWQIFVVSVVVGSGNDELLGGTLFMDWWQDGFFGALGLGTGGGGIVGNTGVRDKYNNISMCGGKCW